MSTNDDTGGSPILDEVPSRSKAEKVELARQVLLRAVAGAQATTLEHRVAWILNHYPAARDSDITLQWLYWEQFSGVTGSLVHRDDLYRLPRLTSLARARAKIQNEYRLFQASESVREHRRTLDDAELDRIRTDSAPHPLFTVYADESGKTGPQLIVGSIWFLEPQETAHLFLKLQEWRATTGFTSELHFQEINASRLPHLLGLVELLKVEASLISLKAISVPRTGIRDQQAAFGQLYYQLLVQGVQHENETRRAPLPRTLSLWKDAEEAGFDQLLLADILDRLQQASTSIFEGKLALDEFHAIDSKSMDLLQLTDLFVGSINRTLQPEGTSTHPKDRFAAALLGGFGIQSERRGEGDVTVHFNLG